MPKFLSNLASDGTVYGQTVSDKIGFFGVTPVVRPSVSATALTASAVGTALLLSALGSGTGGLGLITAGG